MEAPCKTIEHETELGTYRIGMYQDSDPEDPRNWDNLGTMACCHRRYTLGDKDAAFSDPDKFLADLAGVDWDDKRFAKMDTAQTRDAMWKRIHKKYIILPLYLYDHSGITMSTSRFSCPWDSGQVGWIYYDRSKSKKEKFTKSWLNKYHKGKTLEQVITTILTSEVNTYDQFITGDTYGYRIFRPDDEEMEDDFDSCWGFFGDNWKENGMSDYVLPIIASDVKKRLDSKQTQLHQHFEYVKAAIRKRLPLMYRKQLELSY